MITVKSKKISFGKVNLKRYLGLPYSIISVYSLVRDLDGPLQLEHVYRTGDGIQEDYVVLISEPYGIHLEI
jgi:hypothetical protein